MNYLVIYCLFVAVSASLAFRTSDPCIDGNYNFLHEPGLRGGACQKQQGKVICDRDTQTGWYKVQHDDDKKPRKMIEGAVSPDFCGTSDTIWLNGTHPSPSEGSVNRTACVNGVNGPCDRIYNIQIKACHNGDFVYFLRKTDTCNEGYCFGLNMPCAKPNPCESGNNHILHAGGDRSISCKDESMVLCDDTINEVWYRVQHDGKDLKMPTSCVAQHSCGTQFPIWLSENEPTIQEKVVARRACVNDRETCNCDRYYNIQIKNCTTYLVYNLRATRSCPERYCFGHEGFCSAKGQKPSNAQDFLKYVYGSVAAVILLATILSIGAYIWFKKSLRLRKIRSKGDFEDSNGEQQDPVAGTFGKEQCL